MSVTLRSINLATYVAAIPKGWLLLSVVFAYRIFLDDEDLVISALNLVALQLDVSSVISPLRPWHFLYCLACLFFYTENLKSLSYV